jgi:DEAD/DEAH box helicase domain-containing protein
MGHAEMRHYRDAETGGEKLEKGINKSCLVPSAVAGFGIVTVKRSVHGYKKLSHVNRMELSRTTISVPPMEFDTRALWIDADAAYLRGVVLNYDQGVHALSHAMVAVAPLFVACAIADIDCDHSRYATTQILLYDQRAGGSGVTAQLYSFLLPALRAAVELLEECASCYSSRDYDGGCPACLQSVPCDNFHQDISRSAGTLVGKHLVQRLENSTLISRQDSCETNSGHLEGGAIELRGDNDMQCPLKPKEYCHRQGILESQQCSRPLG